MTDFLNSIRHLDYNTYLLFHGAIHGRPWLNDVYLFFAKYGIVFFFLSYIYLIVRRKIHAFITTFVAMAIATFVDMVIVIFWKRPRPFIAHSDEILMPITRDLHVTSFSFPSAHTYIAFAIATSVFLYGHKRLGSVLFLLALAIGVGRIGAGLHYPSDVLAGALLGIASGVVAYRFVRNREDRWR